MLNYEKIKCYFEKGLWTNEMVRDAVKLNKITEEEYKQITGRDY